MNSENQIIIVQVQLPAKILTFEIEKSEFIFGRGGKSDVIIHDGGISREHLNIKFENNVFQITDLKSLNGVYIDGCKIDPEAPVTIQENSVISFGPCALSLKIFVQTKTVFKKTPEQITPASEEVSTPEKEGAEDLLKDKELFDKLIDVSAFPKAEDDYRLSFKNVGLNLPKYKNPGEQAKEIIEEAQYQKRAILKNAEVLKYQTINNARILSKKAGEEAYLEYKKLVDNLLNTTCAELNKMRTDTEILIAEKHLQANEEIQKIWIEHETEIRLAKEKQLAQVENDNKIILDLSIEKAKSDMLAERHKIITDAETDILKKKITYQVEFDNEKNEHAARLKIYNQELQKIQDTIEESKKIINESETQKDESLLELSKVISQLKTEKENLDIITHSFKNTLEKHKVIEQELATFNDNKNMVLAEIKNAQNELENLKLTYSHLVEKKQQTEEEALSLATVLREAKFKAKSEVENEYAALRNIESKKFDDFKADELKELQKIRDGHLDSIKNFSVDLSQEIATKLELLASKNGPGKFDFEKNFELINSVIQIKSTLNTGSESKHTQQLENWKNRKRKENFSLISKGFAAGIFCVFFGGAIYEKLKIDPVKEEQAQMASDNKKRDLENRYVPVRTNKYYDNYVEMTLFTENFSEVYLDKKMQQEWVVYATKYFLKQWKVEEEKVIRVISNSRALVQNVNEMIPNLKKSKIKMDIVKLKELENEYVQKQAAILGTHVKYEAYKKIEKEFFQLKMQGRVPASE